MAGRCRRWTTHVVVWLMTWYVAAAADEAIATVVTWGVEDQTAVVGRLFELRLPRVEPSSVLTVSSTSCGGSRNSDSSPLCSLYVLCPYSPSLHFLKIYIGYLLVSE